eukprot:gene26394-35039_t
MDRTKEFLSLVQLSPISSSYPIATIVLPSLFLIKAGAISKQIESFSELIRKWRIPYIDYHKYLRNPLNPRTKNGDDGLAALSEEERAVLDRHILSFLGSAAAEVNELRQLVDEDGPSSESAFRGSVVQSLGERLSSFSKAVEKMQSELRLRSIDPLRLLSDQPLHQSAPTSYGDRISAAAASGAAGETERETQQQRKSILPLSSGSFAQRFVDEVAPPSKMREYRDIALRRRRALLQESELMHARFGLEFQEAQRMERTVSGISGMIGEFAALIEAQSELVDGIDSVSKEATSRVRQTDAELQLTLERSQSHQLSMTALLLLLSFALLLLDFLSP